MSRIDVYAAISYLAGGGLIIAATGLAQLVPAQATKITAISGIVVGLAGLLLRLWHNPTTPLPGKDA